MIPAAEFTENGGFISTIGRGRAQVRGELQRVVVVRLAEERQQDLIAIPVELVEDELRTQPMRLHGEHPGAGRRLEHDVGRADASGDRREVRERERRQLDTYRSENESLCFRCRVFAGGGDIYVHYRFERRSSRAAGICIPLPATTAKSMRGPRVHKRIDFSLQDRVIVVADDQNEP